MEANGSQSDAVTAEGLVTYHGQQHDVVIDCDFEPSNQPGKESQSYSCIRKDETSDDTRYQSVCMTVQYHLEVVMRRKSSRLGGQRFVVS